MAPTTLLGKESRIVGVIPVGHTRSIWIGHALGNAMSHMIMQGHETVFLRVDTDNGDYTITYSPDAKDIPA